jgi:hypothetical protein
MVPEQPDAVGVDSPPVLLEQHLDLVLVLPPHLVGVDPLVAHGLLRPRRGDEVLALRVRVEVSQAPQLASLRVSHGESLLFVFLASLKLLYSGFKYSAGRGAL